MAVTNKTEFQFPIRLARINLLQHHLTHTPNTVQPFQTIGNPQYTKMSQVSAPLFVPITRPFQLPNELFLIL